MGEIIEVIKTPTVIDVITNNTVVEVAEGETTVIEVDKGLKGDPGTSAAFYYLHVQTVPSSGWLINHNLGSIPSVSVIIGDEEVDADVHHPDENSTYIEFPSPYTGKAVFS